MGFVNTELIFWFREYPRLLKSVKTLDNMV